MNTNNNKDGLVLEYVYHPEGEMEYQTALREWERDGKVGEKPNRKHFVYRKEWVKKTAFRSVTLKENNSGGLLLEVQVDMEELMLFSTDSVAMGNYLYAARNNASLEELRDMSAYGEEIEEEDMHNLKMEWLNEPTIAVNFSDCRNKANVAGLKALRVAALNEDPMKELETCTSVEEVRETVEEFEDLVCPVPYTDAPHNAYERHKCAWAVCRIMNKLANHDTFDDLQSLVFEWGEVCKTLVGAEYMYLTAMKEEEDDSEPCEFEKANVIELACSRVSLQGFKPFELAERLAHLLEGKLIDLSENDFDGASEWFYFKKHSK